MTVDFDIAYDTEDEPVFHVQAYDGALLRIRDQTAGRVSRDVAVEAFAEEFTTGAAHFYPKHLPRSNAAGYLPDLSAWAGDSNGYRHVHLKLPGMAGSTAQLRFEFTQDSVFNCASIRPGHACGVLIDNVVVSSARSIAPTTVALDAAPNPATVGQSVTFTATVTTGAGASPSDGSVTFKEGATVLAGPVALVAGQAAFATAGLGAGAHAITAYYTSTSGLFAASSGGVVEQVGATTTVVVSPGSLAFSKTRVGNTSAAQMVHVTNTGALPLVFATFDGAPPAATFAAGPDFQGQTDCPLGAPGLAPGLGCDVSFVFAPSAAGARAHDFTIVDNAVPSSQVVSLAGTGFIVDEPTVLQSLLDAGNRLRTLQNPDGGWFFNAGSSDCFVGAGVSCPNTLGVTGLGLPFAYSRTGDSALLAVMTAAGDALAARFTGGATDPVYNQDIEFLVALSDITLDPSYAAIAQSWFALEMNQYPTGAGRVDAALARRETQHYRSLAAWDTASVIRAAIAVGQASYALDAANRIVALEPQWKDTDPGSPDPGNPESYELTVLGEGSLLWAFHDLSGFDTQIDEYRAFLVGAQGADGSWNGGSPQDSAYVLVGLAAVGGADNAMLSAGAFFIANQLPEGGWPDSPTTENVEVDGEVARAMATLFNTPSGASVQVIPAQLARVTYSTVVAPGRTSVIGTSLTPGVSIPAGYTILNDLSYGVSTTAVVSGSADVCFGVPWVRRRGRVRAACACCTRRAARFVDRTILSGPGAPSFAIPSGVRAGAGGGGDRALRARAAEPGRDAAHDLGRAVAGRPLAARQQDGDDRGDRSTCTTTSTRIPAVTLLSITADDSGPGQGHFTRRHRGRRARHRRSRVPGARREGRHLHDRLSRHGSGGERRHYGRVPPESIAGTVMIPRAS